MTQEEFKELSQRFYKASQIKTGIYRCQEKLNALEKAGPHTFDEFYFALRDFVPDEHIDEWVKGVKERCMKTLQDQIKIYEQEFKEL